MAPWSDGDRLDNRDARHGWNLAFEAKAGAFEQAAEVSSEHFPGERLVVCRNPLLAGERARKRDELLAATEAQLSKIAAATQRARQPLRGQAQDQRASPVAKAVRSQHARIKDQSRHADDGLPLHSLRTLLQDLATA